jgi:hypothetical protein
MVAALHSETQDVLGELGGELVDGRDAPAPAGANGLWMVKIAAHGVKGNGVMHTPQQISRGTRSARHPNGPPQPRQR